MTIFRALKLLGCAVVVLVVGLADPAESKGGCLKRVMIEASVPTLYRASLRLRDGKFLVKRIGESKARLEIPVRSSDGYLFTGLPHQNILKKQSEKDSPLAIGIFWGREGRWNCYRVNEANEATRVNLEEVDTFESYLRQWDVPFPLPPSQAVFSVSTVEPALHRLTYNDADRSFSITASDRVWQNYVELRPGDSLIFNSDLARNGRLFSSRTFSARTIASKRAGTAGADVLMGENTSQFAIAKYDVSTMKWCFRNADSLENATKFLIAPEAPKFLVPNFEWVNPTVVQPGDTVDIHAFSAQRDVQIACEVDPTGRLSIAGGKLIGGQSGPMYFQRTILVSGKSTMEINSILLKIFTEELAEIFNLNTNPLMGTSVTINWKFAQLSQVKNAVRRSTH